MRNARLDEAQAGIKIGGRNINILRYADDITLTAESEEELKSLLMKMKESEKTGLKLNIQKTKIPPPSAPAPSIQYCASNLDWQLVSYMIFYMFQCHSPKSSHSSFLIHSSAAVVFFFCGIFVRLWY